MKKPRRVQIHVVPNGKIGWRVVTGGYVLTETLWKPAAVRWARAQAIWGQWRAYGVRTEVIIHNRDGSIGKGRGSRMTFPKKGDPKKSAG